MDEYFHQRYKLVMFVATLSVAPLSIGQIAPADVDSRSSGRVIEEVVVTAQRREQNLQDVPISISAVTAETMATMGVEDTTDLAAVAPSLNVTRQWGSVTPYIRGVGTPLVLGGNESAVALYVDGVYVPQLAALTFSFNNIERVEVLKGPQGTLFGRNATGGLIQVVTRDPVSEPTFRARTSVDNYKTIETSLYGSTGLSENVSGDLALYVANQNEGYGENVFSGREVYKRNELGARSSLLWDASATQVRLSLDYFDTESSIGMGRQADRGALTVDGQGPLDDYWNINSNFEPLNTMEQVGATLKVTHDFQNVQLVSLSGYREGHNKYFADQDGTPLAFIDGTIDDDSTTFSQELQLQSLSSGPLNWIVGLYYFDFDVDYRVDTAGSVGPLVGIGGLRTVVSTQQTTSMAAYAQGTYDFNEATSLTLGLRHTADERDFSGTTFLPNAPAPFPTEIPGSAPDNETAEELTWRLALDHRFSDRVLGYVSYNRGFKSGVYNMINPDDAPVESETVDAYEIGVKTDLFDRRVRFNTSLFFYNYDELQAQTIDQGTVQLFNAAEAEIYGGEIEIQALPTDHLELNLALSVTESEYKNFPDADITAPNPAGGNFVCKPGQQVASSSCPESVRPALASQTVVGNSVARAPDFTAALAGRYGIPVASGEIGIGGSVVHNGGFYWEPDNRSEQEAYTLVNLQVDWRSNDQRYRVFIFGKNLTDEEYSQYLSGGSFGDIVSAAPPRTAGIGVEVQF